MEAESIAVLVTGAERRLLEPETRRDPSALEDLLHESFREIGRSGRLWTRDELIDVMTGPDAVDLQSAVVTGEHVEVERVDLHALVHAYGARDRVLHVELRDLVRRHTAALEQLVD